VLEQHRHELDGAWVLAEDGATAKEVDRRLKPILRQAAREILVRLYPQSAEIFDRK
jgi:hypothetical protein